MDWTSILMAGLMVMMIVAIFPAVRQSLKSTPEGSSSDWMAFVLPVLGVVGFVVVLMMLV